MKSLSSLLLGAVFLVLTSCGTDDSVPNNDLAGENGFQFANQVFLTDNVYISNDNTVVLSNHSITKEATVSNINIARFEMAPSGIVAESYFAGERLVKCFTATGANWDRGAIDDGEVILQEADITSGFFRIIELDKNKQNVRLIFEFERKDGELVAGSYEGSYQNADF